mgnify:CR=1 FL=1
MSMDFDALELADNPDPRCPVVIVCDCSDSMVERRPGDDRSPLDALNGGLDVLISELHNDPLAKRRVEVSIVAFGSQVSPATDFATVENLVLPTLAPSGATSMGAAIEEAIKAITERKKIYKENGIQSYQGVILLITDGIATDNIENAVKQVKEGESRKSFAFFAVGVDGADANTLNKFSDRGGLMLKGIKFDELFQWLSASTASVSASTPGDTVPLPSPSGWAEL